MTMWKIASTNRAVAVMEAGPPDSSCRRGVQTAAVSCRSRAGVGSAWGKGPLPAGQVRNEKTNMVEPLLTHRNKLRRHQNRAEGGGPEPRPASGPHSASSHPGPTLDQGMAVTGPSAPFGSGAAAAGVPAAVDVVDPALLPAVVEVVDEHPAPMTINGTPSTIVSRLRICLSSGSPLPSCPAGVQRAPIALTGDRDASCTWMFPTARGRVPVHNTMDHNRHSGPRRSHGDCDRGQ